MVWQEIPPQQWYREVWVCTWCYAFTLVGHVGSEMTRSMYHRWDQRWEAACTDMLPDPRRHAYGLFRATLCGIERPDMTGSQFGMWGGGRDECPACTAAARTIDVRWPVERRDIGDVIVDITPLPLPRDVPGHVSPPDELGLADLRLPELPRRTGRVLPRAAEPVPADARHPAVDAGELDATPFS
ncbi:hypothetical protein [Dactylosporangium sp. NPDC050588]|uniref:hypothetical protein n=1 Tax=Dactylosporangium sp. NPDC050588 TaxID=3157211 RepID=UPI0033D26D4E